MKTLKKMVMIFVALFSGMFTPVLAATVNYVDPGWMATEYFVLENRTRSLEFDSNDQLYIETIGNDGGGQVRIAWLDLGSENPTPRLYTAYETTYYGVNGLSFDGMGSLYVSERTQDANAGAIREINTADGSLVGDVAILNAHRPTGVDSDLLGNVYYTGRLASDLTFGNVYQIDSTGHSEIVIPDIVGTGIAVDDAGNIFVSTSAIPNLGYLENSIYMFDPADLANPLRIATFADPAEELTFDDHGNLYAVDNADHLTITRLSLVPVPAAFWLLGSGVIGLICMKRRSFRSQGSRFRDLRRPPA